MPDQRNFGPRTDGPEQGHPLPGKPSSQNELRDGLSSERFDEWYQEREFRKNIENGTPYFNGSGNIPDPERHSPSQLLQCHRKIFYRQCNTPAEQPDPDGIFWFGSRFEEDIVFPFLERAVTGPDTYVRNSIWVDYTVEIEGFEVRIKGATDPVIVDSEAEPILPIEIKTKSSIENLTSPNRHHKAQLHAYMVGLSEKYDSELSSGTLVYGARDSFDVRFFEVSFDSEFWDEIVLEWTTDHMEYRLDNDLPPSEPERSWECDFCSFRERCGKGDSEYGDLGVTGFVPDYSNYPRENVIEYLDAHDGALLTPTLAEGYPELASEYEVESWHCPQCSASFNWDDIGHKTTADSKPLCPDCASDESLVELQMQSATQHSQNSIRSHQSRVVSPNE